MTQSLKPLSVNGRVLTVGGVTLGAVTLDAALPPPPSGYVDGFGPGIYFPASVTIPSSVPYAYALAVASGFARLETNGPQTWSIDIAGLSFNATGFSPTTLATSASFNFGGPASQTGTITVTDGTTTKTKSITVLLATNAVLIGANVLLDTAPTHYSPTQTNDTALSAVANAMTGNYSGGTTVALTDTTGLFQIDPLFLTNGGIIINTHAALPLASHYVSSPNASLTVTGNGFNYTVATPLWLIHEQPAAIAWAPNPVYDFAALNDVVGVITAFSDAGISDFEIIGGDGTITVETNGTVFVSATLTAGAKSFTVAVTSRNGRVTTAVLTFTVGVGTVLPSSNITMTVASGLKNYLFNANSIPRLVGTPTITGMSGSPVWSIVQGFLANQIFPLPHQTFETTPSTGATNIWGQIDSGTHMIVLKAVSGSQMCYQSFSVPVAACVGPNMYIGRGMVAAHGAGVGFDHVRDWMLMFVGYQDITAYAGADITCYPDNDPDYYANDCGNLYDTANGGIGFQQPLTRSLIGPFNFHGPPTGPMPRFGGRVGSANEGVAGDQGYGNKAFFICGDGEITFSRIEVSFVHGLAFNEGSYPNGGMSGIRQDAGVNGNFTIRDSVIHDCDNGVETGGGAYTLTLDRVLTYNCSASYTGGGLNHCYYIGQHPYVVATHLLSFRAADGHTLKCRAANGTWSDCRFLDGERGQAGNLINLPDGGSHVFIRCVIHKGCMPQNHNAIQFCDETQAHPERAFQNYPVNILTTTSCTHICVTPACMQPVAINHFGTKGQVFRDYSVVRSINDTFCGYTAQTAFYAAPVWVPIGDTHDFSILATNPTFTPTIPALDLSYPTTSGPLESRPGFMNNCWDDEGGSFPGINGTQIDLGNDDARFPVSTSIGTVLFNPTAYGEANFINSARTQPDPRINPFAGGATWSWGQYVNNRYNQPFGLDHSWGAINASSGQITLASTPTAGLKVFALRAVATAGGAAGTIAEWIFYVVFY